MWNSIPEEIGNAPSINSFKNRLDKLWKDKDTLYDYRAMISTKYQKAPQEEEFGIEDWWILRRKTSLSKYVLWTHSVNSYPNHTLAIILT